MPEWSFLSAYAVKPSGAQVLGFKIPLGASPGVLEPWPKLLDKPHSVVSRRPLKAEDPSIGLLWLQQLLALSVSLLHVLRIPVFDPIGILECELDGTAENSWRAVCLLPSTTLVPRNVMTSVLKVAFELGTWAVGSSVENPAKRAYFFAAINKEVLQKLSKAVPRGKSTFEVLRVVHSQNIPYRPLAGGIFQLGWGHKAIRIDRSTVEHDSAMGAAWSQNKLMTAHLLASAGLPAPVHQSVNTLAQAEKSAAELGFPVVVKPADRERGEGVTVDVTPDVLQTAFEQALKCSPRKQVLVERQAPGVCHRLYVVNGELLYAVKRLPMGFYGDGASSVAELLEREREQQSWVPPWKRLNLGTLDTTALEMLEKQGLNAASVPAPGQFVALRRIETTALGGVDEEVTESIHPENLRVALAAAELFGLAVIGVDMISPDITQPWHTNGAIINEVNYAPLLGGGVISQRYIGVYLNRILEHQGRIPVHLFLGGGAAWEKGAALQEKLISSGVAAYLTNDTHTLDGMGRDCVMPLNQVHSRVNALLLRKDVQALVVVMQTAEALRAGPPVDRVSTFDIVDEQFSINDEESPGDLDALVASYRVWSLNAAEFCSEEHELT